MKFTDDTMVLMRGILRVSTQYTCIYISVPLLTPRGGVQHGDVFVEVLFVFTLVRPTFFVAILDGLF